MTLEELQESFNNKQEELESLLRAHLYSKQLILEDLADIDGDIQATLEELEELRSTK